MENAMDIGSELPQRQESYEDTSLEILEYFKIPENNEMLEDFLYHLYYHFYDDIKSLSEKEQVSGILVARFLGSIVNILESQNNNELFNNMESHQRLFAIILFFLNSLTSYSSKKNTFNKVFKIDNINLENKHLVLGSDSVLHKILVKASTLCQGYFVYYERRRDIVNKIINIFQIDDKWNLNNQCNLDYNDVKNAILKNNFSTDEIFYLFTCSNVDKYPDLLITKPDQRIDKNRIDSYNSYFKEYYGVGDFDIRETFKEFFVILESFSKNLWTIECVDSCASFLFKNRKKPIAKNIRADPNFRQELSKLWDNWDFEKENSTSTEISFGQNNFTIPAPFFSARYIVENYKKETREDTESSQNQEDLASTIKSKLQKKEIKKGLIKDMLNGSNDRIEILVDGEKNGKSRVSSIYQIPLDKLSTMKLLMDEIISNFKPENNQTLYNFLLGKYGIRSKGDIPVSRIRFEDELEIKETTIYRIVIFDINSFNRLLVYENNGKIFFDICKSQFYHNERN